MALTHQLHRHRPQCQQVDSRDLAQRYFQDQLQAMGLGALTRGLDRQIETGVKPQGNYSVEDKGIAVLDYALLA